MTEQRQQLENQPPAGPMYQWALDWYNAQEHPLTNEKCEILSRQPFLDPETDVEATIHDMRAAADWQLEQVIEWLTENLCYIQEDGLVRYVYGDGFATIATHEVVRDLKKAMLPQEDN
jgi:hypothetical protein